MIDDIRREIEQYEEILRGLHPNSNYRSVITERLETARKRAREWELNEQNKRQRTEVEIDSFGNPVNPYDDTVREEEVVPRTPPQPDRPVEGPELPPDYDDDLYNTPDRPPSQPEPDQTLSDVVRDVGRRSETAARDLFNWFDLVRPRRPTGGNVGTSAGGTGAGAGAGSDDTEMASASMHQGGKTRDSTHLAEVGLNYTQPQDHAPEGQMLTNTRTALLKWEGYLSVNRIETRLTSGTDGGLNAFDLYLNHPYSPLVGDFRNLTGDISKGGLSVFRAKNGQSENPGHRFDNQGTSGGRGVRARGILFPRQIVCTNDPAKPDGMTADLEMYDQKTVGLPDGLFPSWLSWYEKIYDYYHVLETQYVVTIEHTNNSASDRTPVLIGVHAESYVQNNANDIWPYTAVVPPFTTGANRTTSMTVEQAKRYKGMKWYKLDNRLNATLQPWKIQIKGSWVPGVVEGSVKNLEDIKQWYPTGNPPDPSWNELHGFWFFMGDDGFGAALTTGTTGINQSLDRLFPSVNVKVEMQYKVQFKGLKTKLHFASEPSTDADCTTLVFGRDNCQFPYPIEAHRLTRLGDP
jgi:hypothetical protein